MEIIKRQILLSDLNDSIHFKIPLFQTIDNLGIMTDMPYTSGPQIELCSGGLGLDFMNDGITSIYYREGKRITYGTDSKLEVVRSYNKNTPYIEDFDTKRTSYTNYSGTSINGVDRVVDINGIEVTYVIDTVRDTNIGTTGQTTGILYVDNPEEGVQIPDELDNEITITNAQYFGEGWNDTNTSTSPQIQEEYLLGIISQPEVETDVFIDRTTFSVMDRHLRLSEVESLEHLTKYGNGFYNINRD